MKQYLENELINDIKKQIKKYPLFYNDELVEKLEINSFNLLKIKQNKFKLRYFKKDGVFAKHLYEYYATKNISQINPLIIERNDIFIIIEIDPSLLSKKTVIDTQVALTKKDNINLQIIDIKEQLDFFFKRPYEKETISETLLETLLYNPSYPLKTLNSYYHKKLIKIHLQDENEDGVSLKDLEEFKNIRVYQILSDDVYNTIKKQNKITDVILSKRGNKETKGRLIVTSEKIYLN